MSPTFVVQGRAIALPVEVRKASSWAAIYLVDADAAQRMIDHTGLQVARATKRRAIVSLAFVRYEDGDLDAYNEVAVGVTVRRHDTVPGSPRTFRELRGADVFAYIHHLPVNQPFTLEAGRSIWGYPKFMADIDIDEHGSGATCTLRHDRALVLRLRMRGGGLLPLPMRAPPTYTHMDGVLRLTRWEIAARGTRARLGGATLELGDHPIADELRALGLPRRALFSSSVPQMRARFFAPGVVEPRLATA